MRTTLPIFLCGYVLCLAAGCTHMVENRIVQAFAESLQEHDLAGVKAGSSEDFELKAVKGDETFRALKMINLPEGMPKVVSVKPIKDESGKEVVGKRVVATVGKEKRKVVFRLKPDGDTGRWVVDDLFLSKDDYENNRSVAMRLAVLLSLQESLDAWKAGDRDQILLAATPEFGQALSRLTPEQVAQFAKKCTDEMAPETRILPDERIGDETAELHVARSQGELILKFRRDGQRWKLDNLALESRRSGDDIASARDVTSAMAAALQFEAAYRAVDKRALAQLCTKRFFEGSLAPANLALVKLPQAGAGLDGFDIQLEGSMATYVVKTETETLKISLTQQALDRLHAVPRFLVDEVTIYDLKSQQDKRLSSLFTAHATMEIFGAALAARDVPTLKANATHDFVQRVWSRVAPAHFDGLPISVTPARPAIVQTQFRGSLTEILVEQGETPLTYVLREEGGRMLVDDVRLPSAGWPESMKTTAELLLPVIDFTTGLKKSTMDIVRGNSTDDFSKFAWNHLDDLTDFEPKPQTFFQAPLTSISLSLDRADVVYGDRVNGARFLLKKERGEFKIDDVTLVAGPAEAQQIPLKRTIRTQLAQGDAAR
ncbi:MAG: hypothetical protein ACM3U2_12310 [Deltaproteobacteria bacterium]